MLLLFRGKYMLGVDGQEGYQIFSNLKKTYSKNKPHVVLMLGPTWNEQTMGFKIEISKIMTSGVYSHFLFCHCVYIFENTSPLLFLLFESNWMSSLKHVTQANTWYVNWYNNRLSKFWCVVQSWKSIEIQLMYWMCLCGLFILPTAHYKATIWQNIECQKRFVYDTLTNFASSSIHERFMSLKLIAYRLIYYNNIEYFYSIQIHHGAQSSHSMIKLHGPSWATDFSSHS